MPIRRFALIVLATALCLGACGTKGPLYVPTSPTLTVTPPYTITGDDNSCAGTIAAA